MANKPMTKAQIVTFLADKLEISKKDINTFLEELADLAYKQTADTGSFVLPGFGKLVLSDRKARMGHNPATGEAIKIPAKKTVRMRLAKACKDAILG